MELRQLAYFLAVADEQHFTRAAARMHVSQSGLSATIKSLETELHAPLFERTTRRVHLTAAGAALLPEARRAVAAAHAGAAAVGAIQGLRRGTVSIGVMQQVGIVELPRTLVDYHRRYPNIDLRLRQAPTADLHRMLLAGDLDLAVATSPERVDDRVTAVELHRTPLVLACRADDELAARKAVQIKDLTGRNVIAFPAGWAMRTLSDQLMHRSQQQLDFNLEVNDTATLLDLIEAGLGVALIAKALIQRPGLTGVPLSGRSVHWRISAMTLAPRPSNPAAGELWALIAEHGAVTMPE